MKLSRHNDITEAMDYMLKQWQAFARFLDDGRICLTNNSAEQSLRGVALGSKACLFAGGDRGGEPERNGQAPEPRSTTYAYNCRSHNLIRREIVRAYRGCGKT